MNWQTKAAATLASAALLAIALTAGSGISSASTGISSASTGKAIPSFSANFHAMSPDYDATGRDLALNKLAAAGVRGVRIDADWSWFEYGGKGVLDRTNLTILDGIVDATRARSMQVLIVVKGTPAWANGGKGPNVPPNDPADYANFMRFMAEHFRGRVAAWEVWNEPNLESFWAGRDPARYAALVRAAYPAIKTDGSASVVIGGVSQNDDAWLAQMYAAGVAGSYDVLSTHPYQGPSDGPPEIPDDGNYWILDHIAAVRRLMVAQGDGAKPIWATEFGWSSHRNIGTEQPWERGVTEEQQADYLTRSLSFFAEKHPYVTNVFWYNERDKATGNPHEDGFGLLSRDFSEKPAYLAVKGALATTATTTTIAPTTTTTTTTVPSTTTTPKVRAPRKAGTR